MSASASLVAGGPVPAEPLQEMREGGRDLRRALLEYEKGLIVSALALAQGQQRRAAWLLGIRPTTLNEKMSRLGLRGAMSWGPPAGASVLAPSEEFRWRGHLEQGSTIEVRAASGAIRALPGGQGDTLLVARRRDPSAAEQVAISMVKGPQNVTCSVLRTSGGTGTVHGSDLARLGVDIELRVPAGVRVVARLIAGVIEVCGLDGDVDAHTYEGSVRVRAGATAIAVD